MNIMNALVGIATSLQSVQKIESDSKMIKITNQRFVHHSQPWGSSGSVNDFPSRFLCFFFSVRVLDRCF